MAGATKGTALGPCPGFDSLRADAGRPSVPVGRAASLCRLRPLRHAGELSVFGSLQTARRSHAVERVACAHDHAEIRPCAVKNYILDTNVLLHDPNSLLSFQENNVLIPIEVIEEVDRFKRESTER